MSFCPECGKAVGPSAANCASCGFVLPEAEKKGGGARFKGTVMMTAPAVGLKAAEPANANAKPEAPAVNVAASAGGAPAMRQGAGPAASPAAGASKARNPAAKMTMMGPGIAPSVAKNPPVAAPSASVPFPKKAPVATPAAGVAAPFPKKAPAAESAATPSVRAVASVAVTPPPDKPAPAQFAATQAMPGPPPAPPAKAQSAPRIELPNTDPRVEPLPDPRKVDQASVDEALRLDRERSAVAHVATQALDPAVADAARKAGRYLPGDPMAPGAGAHPAKQSTPRLALQSEDNYVVPKGEKKWMYWAIGGVVLVSVLLLVFGLL